MNARTRLSIISVVVLALFAVSCYWQAPVQNGSLAITFSPRSLARSMNPASNTLRVYMLNSGGTLSPIGPTAHPLYDELSFPAGAAQVNYTSPELPAGQTYSVLAAMGVESSDGFFTPTDFAAPADVTVSAGTSDPLAINLQGSPFLATNLWGAGSGVTGIAVASGSLFASTTQALYKTTGTSFAGFSSLVTLSGRTINSLSVGERYVGGATPFATEPWMNTTAGIVPFHAAGGVDTGFATGSGIQSVLSSASLNDGVSSQVVVYQRLAGMGGLVMSGGSPIGSWIDVPLDQYLTGKPILDFVSGGNFGYFASSLGAFRLPKSVIGGSAAPDQVIAQAKFITVGNSNPPVPILSLAIVGTTLYMGTDRGVWTGTVNTNYPQATTDEALTGTPTLVAGTEGKKIVKIAVRNYTDAGGTHTLIAFLGDSDLFVMNGGALTTFPFYSGLPADLPGDLSDIAWYDTGSAVYLLVAGTKGLVANAVVASYF